MKLPADLQKDLEQIEKYDDAYYNKEPLISDAAYDLFKDRVLKRLPSDHPYLDKIGHDISSAWPKVKHFIFMGSQNKVDTEAGIRDFVKKSLQALGLKKARFVLQHKVDGFSLALQYLDKKLDKALTRGKGVVGENIKPNALMFRDVPTIIPVEKEIQVRGEGVLFKEDIDTLQKARIKETGKPYKNARNAASGIGRRYDGSYSKYVHLIPYDVNAKVKTETEKVKVLKQLGFSPVMTYTCEDVEEVIAVYKRVKEKERATYPYEIDGLVLKFDELELQEKLGVDHSRPLGQIALKFESEKALTTILSIVLQVGRTGKITPVANLEPVELMGSTITRASLHNFARILEDSTGEGAEVSICKRGDIIPQVDEVLNIGDVYEKPTMCPSCGGPLVDDSVNMWCRNKECKERDINRIVYWIETLDIKGFSGRFVEKLWDAGKLRKLSDLYKLKEDDFLTVDGIGEKTIKEFFKVLEKTKKITLVKFLTALGIPGCSTTTSQLLGQVYPTWDKIEKLTESDISKLYGFSHLSASSLCKGIFEIKDMAEDILRVVTIMDQNGLLVGNSFCVTGSLETMSRRDFENLVQINGGLTKNSVSKDLTYLVTNDRGSNSKKNVQASKFGVKVINEQEFLSMIKGTCLEDTSAPPIKRSDVIIASDSLF